jgi:hypothetical protein
MTDNKHIMPQAQWMHEFNDQYRPRFNDALFERSDDAIIDEVSKVIMSCQKDKYFTLKVLSIEAIKDYEDVYNTLRDHYEKKRKKNVKTENPYNYIQIKDSAIMLLKVRYFIQKNGVERMKVDGEDRDIENPNTVLEVLIELPRFVNKYYFRLQGNLYNAIYQIVDGSTYNNSTTNSSKNDNVTLKTLFMSVRIYRMFRDILDVNSKEKIHSIIYTSIIFRNHVNVMLYLLAKYGMYACFELFHIHCIKLTYEPITDPDWYSFKKHNIYVNVPKEAFSEPTIQSMVVTILDGIFKDSTIDGMFTWGYWLTVLGYAYKNSSIDKGIFVLDSLESIYDINTKESIHLPEEDKRDIYMVLKWLICQFPELRSKDNVDVSIKRIRIAEYIAHVYAMKLTRGIHRISDLGKKVKLKQIISAVYTQPQYIVSKIILMSNLVSYVDLVNDNDATQVLKCTYKGISGLGEDGAKVQPIYRFVDPSHLGILDLDTSSASDPGMTGMLCPMTNIEKAYGGKSFTAYQEPNDWEANYINRMNAYYKNRNKINPIVYADGYKPKFDYDYIKDDMIRRSLNMERKDCPIVDINGVIDYRFPMDKQPHLQDLTGQGTVITESSLFDIPTSNEVVDELKKPIDLDETTVYTPYVIDG